ncbi:MAG: alpha/beta hydrolase fold domain-containing protein, partial [Geminicoccaceae bacterium]
MPKVYNEFSADEIEAQYNLRAGRPDYETTVIPDWVERSVAAREKLGGRLDLAYGPSDRQKIDLFTTGKPEAPTLVYLHGGYWQRGEKAIYSFLAEPFISHGANVAIIGYDLCPSVSITAISAQIREALAWTWRQAGDLGIERERLTVMGHSAGGHLTGMMMGTDWTTLGSDLPPDLVKAGIPV